MPPVIRCGKEAGSSFYLVGYYFYTYYITLYGKGAVIYFSACLQYVLSTVGNICQALAKQ